MKHLPNLLTLLRMLLVPVFPYAYFSGHPSAHIYALGIFILASLTDMLDGQIARRYHLITKLGIVLDPLADKLMLLMALFCLYLGGSLPLWVLVFVLVYETFMISMGLYLYVRQEKFVIPSNRFGKLATAIFFIGVILNILLPWHSISLIVLGLAILIKTVAIISYIIHYQAHHKDHLKHIPKAGL